MNERLKIGLEMARRENLRLQREHPLEQLFWECTLRCNLSCRHCGSDCAKDLTATEMPFAGEKLSVVVSSGEWLPMATCLTRR